MDNHLGIQTLYIKKNNILKFMKNTLEFRLTLTLQRDIISTLSWTIFEREN